MTSQTPEAISQAVQNGSTKKAVPQAPPKRALSQAVDFSSVFIGSRSENAEVFEGLILKALRGHVDWRKKFHPEDKDFISEEKKKTPEYQSGIEALNDGVDCLMRRLNKCFPFYSHRYIGHMLSDTTMASQIGYFAAMLFNANNVSSETKRSSPTIQMEMEAIAQLATVVGYTNEKHWGHLTSGGTIANFEALWVARNFHYGAIAMYFAAQELDLLNEIEVQFVNGKSAPLASLNLWQLVNLSPQENQRLRLVLQDLSPRQKDAFALIRNNSISELGIQEYSRRLAISSFEDLPDGVVIVSSWKKICGAVGIGSNQLIRARNDSRFRMDPDGLYSLIKSLCEQRRSIIALVVTLGSTEVGAIDPVHKVLEVRKRVEQEFGITFYLHVDAAWGGYSISTTYCSDGSRKEFSKKLMLSEHQVEMWPEECIYHSLCAVEFTDSITIDPHKLGYVPYPSGAILFRQSFMRQLLAQGDIPYAFHTDGNDSFVDDDRMIGMYTMEGSKPGAAAGAVWLSHRVLPLNETGYGHLIQKTCNAARTLRHYLATRDWNGFSVAVLPPPDLNIVCFSMSHPLLRSLPECNALVRNVMDAMNNSPTLDFMVTTTKLQYEIYGAALHPIIESLGFYDSGNCYMDAKGLGVIRCAVMNPILCETEQADDDTAEEIINSFLDYLQSTMETQVKTMLYQKSARVPNIGGSFSLPNM